jgi:hypothetical protein
LASPASFVRRTLDRLASRNLLALRIAGDLRYQFQPGDAAAEAAAGAFAHAYRTNRLAVVRLVTHERQPGFRDFADAFRIRRDDDR